MEWSTSIFLNKWHLLVVVLGVISIAGLAAGEFPKEDIKKTVKKIIIYSYMIITGLLAISVWAEVGDREEAAEVLDKVHAEEGKDFTFLIENGGSPGDYRYVVYAGNYSKTEKLSGTVTYRTYLKNGKLQNKTVKELELEPGEKLRIDTHEVDELPDRYRFEVSRK